MQRLRLIILENKNMWDALNKGINESKGNIIGILNLMIIITKWN